MKTNNILKLSAGLLLGIGLSACSGDYLDLKPEGTIQNAEVLANAQGATLAVHGACQDMYRQYSSFYDMNWFNGEPWLSMVFGEVVGQDFVSLFWFNSQPGIVNWQYMISPSSFSSIAWSYSYGIINKCNLILSGVCAADDVEGELAFRKAQAKTLRAHAYLRLMQIFCNRFEDNQNGEALTVPLRLTYVEPEGDLNMGPCKWSELMGQIYRDLEDAIELYDLSGMRRTYKWEPGIEIAQGILARAAMINHDYPLAEDMAKKARANYPLMTYQEYCSGFALDQNEYMWVTSDQSQGLYFASFGATYACNGAYPCGWASIGAGAINYDLAKQFNTRDERRYLYFTPKTAGTKAKAEDFWKNGSCNSGTMNINSYNSALHQAFVEFCTRRYAEIGAEKSWDLPYTYPGYPIQYIGYGVTAPFGAHFKFWGIDSYSSSVFPFMRGAEMLLTEAEAAFYNEKPETALSLLQELVDARYSRKTTLNYSGEELLAQIKLQRRMELWGEGFNWFDYKRWNEPIVRIAWSEGDQNSGNWPNKVAGQMDPDVALGWRWRVPSTEYQYNPLMSPEILYGSDN